jgi:hypothetical protein
MDRYARQRLLATVGDRGQERIARATFVVQSVPPWAAHVEREYLTRAGAQHVAEGPASEPPVEFAHAALFRHATTRDFAEGAWRALAQLRSTLEPSS